MFTQRQGRRRSVLVITAVALLSLPFLRQRNGAPAVHAQPERDPDVIWQLGKTDNSADEFAAGAVRELTYEVGQSTPRKDWRQRQDAAPRQAPAYRIRFALPQAPPTAVLTADVFFLGLAPSAAVVDLNGKRGFCRIQPASAPNIDERQSNQITYSRQSLQIPLDASLFRQSGNELAISFLGDGGSVYYDALALRRSGGGGPELSAAIEPTIFYRRNGEHLKEVAYLVLNHRLPLAQATAEVKIGAAVMSHTVPADEYDFGERVLEFEAPAVSGAKPYQVRVSADGKTASFKGQFRPEKRWRIFAGLKIHNDIGYTDLQPHVQELDSRNTDGVLDLAAKFPFYKFNLETGWLVENYLQSRNSLRARRLMALALRERIGINAMYLNLMTGICTGEEMYRSLYYSKSLQRKYGIPLKFACLTDAPSHTWFVPTMLSDAGVKGFANGSNQTRAPLLQNSDLNEDSPFYWEGPNGRKVMAWFARSYLQLNRLAGNQPSVDVLRRSVPQFLARYRRDKYPVDAVLLYGLYTDNADIRGGEAEILREWNQTYAFPKITPATDGDYYAYLAEHFTGKLPSFRGDAGAYWEDGAASTAAETAINRDTQRLLPAVEMAASWATLFQPRETYPAGEFRDAWKNLMFYDEHTWGANRSISQPDRRFVTDQWEFKRAYAMRAHWLAKDLHFRSFNRLVQNISVGGPTMFVFNPDLWARSDIVELELEPSRELFDLATENPLPVDIVSEKDGCRVLRFLAEKVPGLGYKAYGVRPAKLPKPKPSSQDGSWTIESRYYRVVVDPKTGAIAQLFDKELGRDLADRKAAYKLNELLYVSGGENSRILHDVATLPAPKLEIAGAGGARLLENVRTPFGRRIRVRAKAKSIPSIETEINVYDSLKRVDIVNRLVKNEVRAKEAVYFAYPFAVSPPELAYQIQNAFVHPNSEQLPGACRDWFTTQNLVIARDAGVTIAWATPDAPLVTLTDINRGQWLKHLPINNGHVFSYVMNNYWFTNYKASQGGEFTFRYSVTSAAAIPDAALARFDAETRSPLIGYGYYDTGNVRLQAVTRRMPLAGGSFLSLEAGNAQVTAFKQAEDGNGYILRLRETAGQSGTARIESPAFTFRSAFLSNGVEDNTAPLAVNKNTVEAPLKPREFTTVRLVP